MSRVVPTNEFNSVLVKNAIASHGTRKMVTPASTVTRIVKWRLITRKMTHLSRGVMITMRSKHEIKEAQLINLLTFNGEASWLAWDIKPCVTRSSWKSKHTVTQNPFIVCIVADRRAICCSYVDNLRCVFHMVYRNTPCPNVTQRKYIVCMIVEYNIPPTETVIKHLKHARHKGYARPKCYVA